MQWSDFQFLLVHKNFADFRKSQLKLQFFNNYSGTFK